MFNITLEMYHLPKSRALDVAPTPCWVATSSSARELACARERAAICHLLTESLRRDTKPRLQVCYNTPFPLQLDAHLNYVNDSINVYDCRALGW